MKKNLKPREGPKIEKAVPLNKEVDLRNLNSLQHLLIAKAYSIVRCGATAKEIVSNAYLKIWQMEERKYLDIIDLFSYTCTIVKREALLYKRKRANELNKRDQFEIDFMVIRDTRFQSRKELREILEELPSFLKKREYTIFHLWVNGVSYQDIAEEMNDSINAIRGVLTRTKIKVSNYYHRKYFLGRL